MFGWRGALAAGAWLAGAGAARAHGSSEIEIFSYLLEEPGFFRLTAGILGTVLFLLGAFIAWQGRRVWGWLAEEPGDGEPEASRARMMAPGALLALAGTAIIFAAAFILPDKVVTGGHHPAGQEKPNQGQP